MNDNEKWLKGIFILLLFLSIVVVGILLKTMGEVIKPVVVSAFLSFVFLPIINKLQKKLHIPWWCGAIIIFVLVFAVIFGIGNILTASYKSILNSAPFYEEKFNSIQKSLTNSFSNDSNFAKFFNFDENVSVFENIHTAINLDKIVKTAALEFTSTIFNFTRATFLVILFSFFLLAEMIFSTQKISKIFGKERGEKAINVLQNITKETTQYITIKFTMSVISGVFVTIVCSIFKMDFAIIWGFLAFVMNFIPTFGSLIASVATAGFALIQFYPNPIPILSISILIIVENILIGNVIEPKIAGKDLNLSPFVILTSLLLWSWIWGFLGLVLAIPLTVTVKIICENVSILKPVAMIIGSYD